MKKLILTLAVIAGSSALAIAYNASQKTGDLKANLEEAAPASMSCCKTAAALEVTAADPEKPKAKPYPLETCIVSDEKLGGMGKPVVFEYQGQEIKLCCKACRKKFDADPATLLKKLEPKK